MEAKQRTDGFTTKTPVQSALVLLNRLHRSPDQPPPIPDQPPGEGQQKILVGLSGGKDSIVVLDLCVTVFGAANVQPFHLYLLPDLRCEQEILDRVVRYYPEMPKRIELPRAGLRENLASCTGRSITPSLMDRLGSRSLYNEKSIERIVRSRTGIRWIAGGHRIFDSLHRRGMLHRCQGFWKESYKTGTFVGRIYPIFLWHPQDVFSYLKTRKLPIPDMMQFSAVNYTKSSGTSIVNPVFIQRLKLHYPDDYAKLKRLFPNLEDSIKRDESRAKYGIDNQLGLETDYGNDHEATSV